ncbi:hypothetical protein [Halobaculum lipolyticum]|uniref:DUF7847 domain-containing protein n=1 Tax=Halobaculum lipolyticum TaxID=3032001 RepID=A0ABD5WH19_9EURY|nr:hypothetical protein [Halobaculum sp. DT31]
MALLSAFRRTPSTLLRNPVLFVPVLVLSLLQTPQLLLQSSAPILASVVSLAVSALFLVVTPFVQAGLIGMADEALDGPTSLSTFVAAGKANFVQVFLVYLVLVGVNVALGVLVFLAVILGFAGVSLGGGGGNTALLVVAALVGVAVVVAYLLLAFLVQFYGQAIVVDGFDALGSIKHSYAVVRGNLVSVLGYTLLVGVLAGVFGVVVGVSSAMAAPAAPTDPLHLGLPSLGAVAVAALVVVLGTLFGSFFGVFSVSYYRALTN